MSVSIILNGTALNRKILDETVICADGGYNLLPKDIIPLCIIGDCDSIKEKPENIEIISFPPEKNMTDGELALRYAIEKGYKKINIFGALGGRQDHVLGNLALLSLADRLGAEAIIRENNLDIYFAKGLFELNTSKGDTVSVIPIEETLVKHSKNLLYPLENLILTCNDTRGLSNISKNRAVSLEMEYGSCMVFHYFD